MLEDVVPCNTTPFLNVITVKAAKSSQSRSTWSPQFTLAIHLFLFFPLKHFESDVGGAGERRRVCLITSFSLNYKARHTRGD